MDDLQKLSKAGLIACFIEAHDRYRNQASRLANAMGGTTEASEKDVFDRLAADVKRVEAEILRRIP